MPEAKTSRRRPARPLVGRLTAYIALRMTERPADLGRIDWLLHGRRANPYRPHSARFAQYNAAYDLERKSTPRPQGTRLRRTP